MLALVLYWDGFGTIATDSFPPGGARPVSGYVVDPTDAKGSIDEGLYLGFRVLRPGRYVLRGADVVYEQDGERRTLHIDTGMVVCASPPGRPYRDCPID